MPTDEAIAKNTRALTKCTFHKNIYTVVLPRQVHGHALRRACASLQDENTPYRGGEQGFRIKFSKSGRLVAEQRTAPSAHPFRLFVESTFMTLASVTLASVLSSLTRQHGPLRLMRPAAAAGIICAAVLTGGAALANPSAAEEVSKLLEQGRINEAARLAQNHLKQNANDVQVRFLQGVIASEQRKYDQAIQIFTALSQDFPMLPEPYNNLAVLYAAKGDERKAAQVLEQAIRTNPSYATAHENLGDLYARMASDAYAKALQLDSNRQAVQPKLSLITQIFSNQAPRTAGAKPTATAAAAPATPVAAVTPAASALQEQAPQPVAAPTASVAAASAAAASTQAHAAPTLAPSAPVIEPAAKPTAVAAQAATQPVKEASKPEDNSAKQASLAVEKAVGNWAKAWAQQNMSAYYAAYSNRFEPQGSTLSAWKTERKERIVGKPAITVEVRDLKVQVKGEQATASFRQYYASGGYKATTRKTLRLQYEGGQWRITREETGR